MAKIKFLIDMQPSKTVETNRCIANGGYPSTAHRADAVRGGASQREAAKDSPQEEETEWFFPVSVIPCVSAAGSRSI